MSKDKKLEEQMNQNLEVPYEDHVDSVIYRHDVHNIVKWWVIVNRMSALAKTVAYEAGVNPQLFADFEGRRVKVVMASRLGDVGITHDLKADHGYSVRVLLKQLSNFSDKK